MAPPLITSAHTFAEVFSVSRETLVKIETYYVLLRQWQKTINLVSPATLDDAWHRHFADSAQLVALARSAVTSPKAGEELPRRWLDLGSGAGFPGLVIAILLSEQPETHVTLIESDQRKSAFLREVSRQTRTPVEILSIRAEKAATQFRLPLPDVVTARALAPLERLLQLVHPFFAPGTVGLFLKGREAEREVDAARRSWQFDCTLEVSLTDPAARILVVRNLEPNSEG